MLEAALRQVVTSGVVGEDDTEDDTEDETGEGTGTDEE